jgi:hypothetical protein
MIAYNRTSLDNMIIRKQADEAFGAGCISPEENTKIGVNYPVYFYTPNIFICIGLFLLTTVIVAFSLGLLFLIGAGGINSVIFLLIFSALVCYGALEYTVHKRRHFRSGVDYALLWMSAGLLFTGLYLTVNNMSTTSQCIIIFTISLLFTLRFINHIMALVAYMALLAFIFNISAEPGGTTRLITPFILMTVSVACWFLCFRFYIHENFRHYRQCLNVLKVSALISFYLAGNYFVVRELSNYMFGSFQHVGERISLGWLFWILTVATPVLYISQGIWKKDHIFLWVGLLLMAATVFTVRHYYSVLPAEWAMMFGGIGIIAIAYGLIRYLKIPRYGLTSQENNNKHLLEKFQIESLVIAETFAVPAAAPAPANDFQFGGGSGGGGGAGGQY